MLGQASGCLILKIGCPTNMGMSKSGVDVSPKFMDVYYGFWMSNIKKRMSDKYEDA
jgi:hypothetical protein